jgi:hypothetical protein
MESGCARHVVSPVETSEWEAIESSQLFFREFEVPEISVAIVAGTVGSKVGISFTSRDDILYTCHRQESLSLTMLHIVVAIRTPSLFPILKNRPPVRAVFSR